MSNVFVLVLLMENLWSYFDVEKTSSDDHEENSGYLSHEEKRARAKA